MGLPGKGFLLWNWHAHCLFASPLETSRVAEKGDNTIARANPFRRSTWSSSVSKWNIL
jgi:hypothetical protein